MRRVRIITAAVVAIIIAVALPIGGALYVAQRVGIASVHAQATTLAESLQRVFETASAQGDTIMAALSATARGAPCSPASIGVMRDVQLSSSYVEAAGYVEGGRLRCTGSGVHGDGYRLPEPAYTSSRGLRIRRNIALPHVPNQRFIIAEDTATGFAVVFHGNLGFDLFEHIPGMAAGLVARSTNEVIAHRGFLAREWLAPRGTADRYHLISRGHVFALVESAEFDFGVYSAIPTPPVSQQLRGAAMVLVPIGAAVAGILVLLIVMIIRAQFSIPVALQLALKRGEIFMEYQPVVDLQTRRWVGAEALIRWRRDSGRLVRPDVFVQIAEDTGMIQLLTERVFQLVARDMAALSAAGDRSPFHIAVNVSAADLQSDRTVGLVRELVDATSGAGLSVIVEATERGLLDEESCREIIDAIRGCGAAIALDDFGTGYSSLSYIRKFSLDYLKIDRAFIETIGTDSPTRGVVRHIIGIGRTMKLEVVAEGVETEIQAAYLEKHGVRLAQGWLFGRPMPIDALIAAFDASHGGTEMTPCQPGTRPFTAFAVALQVMWPVASGARRACMRVLSSSTSAGGMAARPALTVGPPRMVLQ